MYKRVIKLHLAFAASQGAAAGSGESCAAPAGISMETLYERELVRF
jgi:hypothetical protein